MNGFNFVIAAGLGSLLAAAELLSRYRDEPLRVIGRGAAWFYIVVNASASMGALLLIDQFGWTFDQTGQSLRTTQVLVAGFGSAALFRSSLFIFKVGDDNVGMGPSILLNSLLGAADRSVDRNQATERLRVTGSIMAGVDFDKAHAPLVAACLAAAANVPPQEALDLRESVVALSASDAQPSTKSVVLGILIIDAVGADVLRQAVDTLGEAIK